MTTSESRRVDLDRDVRWYYAELTTKAKTPIVQECTVLKHTADVDIATMLNEVTDDLERVLGLPLRHFCNLVDREIVRENPEIWNIHPTSVAHFFGKIHRVRLIRRIKAEPDVIKRLTMLYMVATNESCNPLEAQSKIDRLSADFLLAPSTKAAKFATILRKHIPPEAISAIGSEVLMEMSARRLWLIERILSEKKPSPIIAAKAMQRLGKPWLLSKTEDLFIDKFEEALARAKT
jgi:hypothetical protein